MTYVIDKLHAVTDDAAPAKPFKSVPSNPTPSEVVQTLRSLGVIVPTKLSAAAGQGQLLRTAEHRFSLKEIDTALSKHDVPTVDRIRLKQEMVRNQILGN